MEKLYDVEYVYEGVNKVVTGVMESELEDILDDLFCEFEASKITLIER